MSRISEPNALTTARWRSKWSRRSEWVRNKPRHCKRENFRSWITTLQKVENGAVVETNNKPEDTIVGNYSLDFTPGITQADLKNPMSSSITAFGPTGTRPGTG